MIVSSKRLIRKFFRKQFQIKNWFSYDWFELQQNYTLDMNKYLSVFPGETFNEAKQNYYSSLTFNTKKMFHEEELVFFKEWGGLNHPPQHKQVENLGFYSKNFSPINYNEVESKFFDTDFNLEIDQITQSELSFGNELEVLEDNEAYIGKLNLIKSAKSSIFMSSLVFVCDKSTKALTLELIKKAESGVSVYVMHDSLISTLLWHKECPKMMKKAGIKFISGNDAFKYEGNAIYHSKKLIVDFNEAIIGGHNMLNADNLSNGTDFKNRDLDLYAKGPVVTDIAKGFIEDYEHFYNKKLKQKIRKANRIYGKRAIQIRSAKRSLENWKEFSIANQRETLEAILKNENDTGKRGQELYDEVLSNKDLRMKGVCRFLQQSSYNDRTSIGKGYLKYLDNTKSYLGIMTLELLDTKYLSRKDRPLIEKFDNFEMYNKLHDKIQLMSNDDNMQIDLLTSGPEVAGNEGVAILLEQIRKDIANGKTRTANTKIKLTNFWNNDYRRPHYNHLIKDYVTLKNVDIWIHISFTHPKVFYFDRVAVSIGLYNLHHNATDHAFENTVICTDEKLNNEMDEAFVRDMINSVPLVYKDLTK